MVLSLSRTRCVFVYMDTSCSKGFFVNFEPGSVSLDELVGVKGRKLVPCLALLEIGMFGCATMGFREAMGDWWRGWRPRRGTSSLRRKAKVWGMSEVRVGVGLGLRDSYLFGRCASAPLLLLAVLLLVLELLFLSGDGVEDLESCAAAVGDTAGPVA